MVDRSQILHDSSCRLTVDQHLENVSDLLPIGRCWPRDSDSTLMRYWRSFSEMVKFTEDRICDLAAEFYCSTTTEKIALWAEQYGIEVVRPDIDPLCLKVGFEPEESARQRICAKVAAGVLTADVTGFEEAALALGWVVTVDEFNNDTLPVAGCAITGCVSFGPTPEPLELGSNLGDAGFVGEAGQRAVENLDVAYWPADKSRIGAKCGSVPGTELGISALGDDCCNIAGYYERPSIPDVEFGTRSACGFNDGVGIGFTYGYVVPPSGAIVLPTCNTDTSGMFREYLGNAHAWRVTVDMPASVKLQEEQSPFLTNFAFAGCCQIGNQCTPIRKPDQQELIDFLDDIKPAHTIIRYEYIWN